MTPPKETTPAPGRSDDASAGLIRDMSKDAPPKDLGTVKAASDAIGGDAAEGPDQSRRARIERRAYALWEADGSQHGRHEDYWAQAEAELAREE